MFINFLFYVICIQVVYLLINDEIKRVFEVIVGENNVFFVMVVRE